MKFVSSMNVYVYQKNLILQNVGLILVLEFLY